MGAAKEFTPLVPPQAERPRSNWHNSAKLKIFLRDQLTIESWLCLGALLQGALFLVGGSITLLPALGLILYRIAISIAMSRNWIHNTHMDNIIQKKHAAAFPDELGDYGSTPADSDVVVFLIGARCNSPLGMLAPGFKELGDYFNSMAVTLDQKSEEFGFLNMTSWLNASDRETSSEIMAVCYFRTIEGLHQFAHSPYHREGWDWWNKNFNSLGHLSIWHETYHVPRKNWEAIYVNSHIAGINSTTFPVTDKETGEKVWARPIVDASRGLLKTSAGRMSRSAKADEHRDIPIDPYDV